MRRPQYLTYNDVVLEFGLLLEIVNKELAKECVIKFGPYSPVVLITRDNRKLEFNFSYTKYTEIFMIEKHILVGCIHIMYSTKRNQEIDVLKNFSFFLNPYIKWLYHID